MIQAMGVKKSFWNGPLETPVLKGVDLGIPEKSRLVITGASGSGKSTLLHLLASLDPPTSGQVLYRGEDLYRKSDAELSRLRNEEIGFVFQFHHLLPEFSALENVMVPLLIRGTGRKEAHDRASELLSQLGLGSRLRHLPSELSGGEQQRVAVGRAVVGRPKILFADEPTGNLDQENGDRLIELLLKFQEQAGRALVLVTHNGDLVKHFTQKKVLVDGRLIAG